MTDGLLTIGKLAAGVGVTPDTLRYYERLGLLPPPSRTRSGYRLYQPALAERVAFIGKAKALGLTLEEIREVLRVAADGTPPCEHLRATLSRRLREVETRVAELEELRGTLARALRRSRKQPVSRSCVCEIIEFQEMSRSGANRSKSASRGRRARTTKKEAL